jgi:hypothetical protein
VSGKFYHLPTLTGILINAAWIGSRYISICGVNWSREGKSPKAEQGKKNCLCVKHLECSMIDFENFEEVQN